MTRATVLAAARQLLAIAAAVLSGTLAYAQEGAAAIDDPPVRVGRMSFVSGDVSFSPAGNEEWVQARVNRPIVTGDQLWSDNNARAELTIDNSTWWLGENTSVTVSNLDDRIAQLQVQQGTLDFRVRRLPSGQIVEIDTPNLAFTVTRPGQYRVAVDPQDGATTVVVRSGAGDVYGENASYALASGQAYRFYGNDLRDSESLALPPPDAFDRFVAERDRRYERVESARYVSPEVIGYEDLDTYGAWTVEASYGSVWFPRNVRSGWAPYHDGHWAWIDPWGWTWVDDEPWGFAPFHYGRWAHFNRGWGWIPGPRNVRPVYAPALVAFVGGSGFSISVSSGPAIGWFPLGPREVYRPWYHVSRDYFRQVNVSNTVVNQVNITNVYNNYRNNTNVTQVNYVNMRAPNAVTAVPPTVFAQSQSVSRAAVALPAATIARAQVQSFARVAPARAALVGAAPVVQARPPAAVAQRSVVARRAPPPPPVPDAQKLQALERNPGQPLTRQQVQQMRQSVAAQAPARSVRVVDQPKPAANAAPPARPAGERATQRAQRSGAPPAGAAPPAGGGAPSAAPGAPDRAATPPNVAPGQGRGAPSAGPGAPRGAPPERGAPEGKGPPVAQPPRSAEGTSPGSVPRPPDGDRSNARQMQERAQEIRRSQQAQQPGAVPQDRPQPQVGPQPQARPQSPARPPDSGPSSARQMQQERAQERQQERAQERPQPRAMPQEPPQPPGGPQPQARPQPPARPPDSGPSSARQMQQERAQERPQPQARPQPQERPQTQARPQPQERPQPQARPQPQERPQPQARPQPQERPQPQARPQPERPQPQRPQGGRGNDKDKDKDKDKG